MSGINSTHGNDAVLSIINRLASEREHGNLASFASSIDNGLLSSDNKVVTDLGKDEIVIGKGQNKYFVQTYNLLGVLDESNLRAASFAQALSLTKNETHNLIEATTDYLSSIGISRAPNIDDVESYLRRVVESMVDNEVTPSMQVFYDMAGTLDWVKKHFGDSPSILIFKNSMLSELYLTDRAIDFIYDDHNNLIEMSITTYSTENGVELSTQKSAYFTYDSENQLQTIFSDLEQKDDNLFIRKSRLIARDINFLKPINNNSIEFKSSGSEQVLYVVKRGETLRDIAKKAYGSESFWYLIAEANQLDNSFSIAAGQILTLMKPDALFFQEMESDSFYSKFSMNGLISNSAFSNCDNIASVIFQVYVEHVAWYIESMVSNNLSMEVNQRSEDSIDNVDNNVSVVSLLVSLVSFLNEDKEVYNSHSSTQGSSENSTVTQAILNVLSSDFNGESSAVQLDFLKNIQQSERFLVANLSPESHFIVKQENISLAPNTIGVNSVDWSRVVSHFNLSALKLNALFSSRSLSENNPETRLIGIGFSTVASRAIRDESLTFKRLNEEQKLDKQKQGFTRLNLESNRIQSENVNERSTLNVEWSSRHKDLIARLLSWGSRLTGKRDLDSRFLLAPADVLIRKNSRQLSEYNGLLLKAGYQGKELESRASNFVERVRSESQNRVDEKRTHKIWSIKKGLLLDKWDNNFVGNNGEEGQSSSLFQLKEYNPLPTNYLMGRDVFSPNDNRLALVDSFKRESLPNSVMFTALALNRQRSDSSKEPVIEQHSPSVYLFVSERPFDPLENYFVETFDLNTIASATVRWVNAPIDFDGHIFSGEVKANGNVVGGHSIADDNVRVLAGTQSKPNRRGIYHARIAVPDPFSPGHFLEKTNNGGFSTMFPDSWTAERIKVEVASAYKNRVVFNNKWSGETPSGVKVEGWIFPKITVYPKF